MPNLPELYSLLHKLEMDRVETENRWQDVIDYICPDRKDITDTTQNDQELRRFDYLLDGVGIISNNRLYSNMNAFLNSLSIPWFMLSLDDPDTYEQRENKEWLAHATKRMQDSFARSNFYREAVITWGDITSFNTGGFSCEDTDGLGKNIRYESVPCTNLYVKMDKWRRPHVVMRKLCLSIYDIVQRWPQAEELDSIKKKTNDASSIWDELDVVHFCVPVDMWDGSVQGNGKGSTEKSRKQFASIYAIEDEETPLNASDSGDVPGYRMMPYSLPCWERSNGSVYGVGPGLRSVYDIKSLNLLTQRIQEVLPFAINPPIKAEEGAVISWGENGKLAPGCLVEVAKGKFDRVAPLYDSSRGVQIGEIERERMQNIVREHFYYNDLLLFPERPEMTAYEIQRRFEMLQRNFSTPIGFVQSDWHDPVVEWTFETMERHGLFEERPASLKDVPVKVVYIGPLARAQKLPEVLATQEFVQRVVAAAMSADKRELMEVINWYETFSRDAEFSGVPLDLLKSPEEYEAKIKQLEQQAQVQQEMEAAKTGAQALQAGGRGAAQLRSVS